MVNSQLGETNHQLVMVNDHLGTVNTQLDETNTRLGKVEGRLVETNTKLAGGARGSGDDERQARAGGFPAGRYQPEARRGRR